MLFTELQFWVLFAVTLSALALNSYVLRNLVFQNLVLLAASYIFYGAWDWRFLGLIIFCSAQTYYLGGRILRSPGGNAAALWTSVGLNLAILGFFKYYNFFVSEAVDLLSGMGFAAHEATLSIILPVGISFYIFQSLTFVIDIHRGEIKRLPPALNYFTFIAFFPQLVAGPIERATNLLPQFERITRFHAEAIWQGVKLIIFGLFLKVAVADNLAPKVDDIFSKWDTLSGGELILGALYFTAQIYGDFCGYSTIAIGVAAIMGFRLMTNFNTPYLATSIQDFWRRWHISLSTFFRDYVYIPLGGNRVSDLGRARNSMITFTVSGLWHGANWTFIVWGFLHGLLLEVQKISRQIAAPLHRFFATPPGMLLCWGMTLFAVVHLWIFFRADSIGHAGNYIYRMYADVSVPGAFLEGLIYISWMIVADLLWRGNVRLEADVVRWKAVNDLILSLMLITVLGKLLVREAATPFIYFQF